MGTARHRDIPDIVELRGRFVPNPEALPVVAVKLTALSACDARTAAAPAGRRSAA